MPPLRHLASALSRPRAKQVSCSTRAPVLTPVAQVVPAAASPRRLLDPSRTPAARLQIGIPTYRPYTDMAARIAPLWSSRAQLPCSDAP